MGQVSGEVTVVNKLGMHARPSAAVVQTVLNFHSDVYISYGTQRVNAKSIMGLLTLAAAQGARLEVACSGPDAEEALQAVQDLFASGFGEE